MIRKGYRDLINTAIHNYYHDDIPLEMELKDYFYEVQSKSEAFDELRHIMDYHYPDKEDREGVRGYQHPKVALKNIGDVIEEYESGERNELRE